MLGKRREARASHSTGRRLAGNSNVGMGGGGRTVVGLLARPKVWTSPVPLLFERLEAPLKFRRLQGAGEGVESVRDPCWSGVRPKTKFSG